jgi:rhodanese-related sulfurtransferase/rubrerythrin
MYHQGMPSACLDNEQRHMSGRQNMGAMDFKNVTHQELKNYQQKHKESEYQLIDVRQTAEYSDGHIPGARLLPLDELEGRIGELPQEQDIVFYCRSGARSQAAAIIALDENPALKDVFNLMGGFMAWDGHVLTDFPKVEVFSAEASLEELMYRSMDLEKAAQRFYEVMHAQHTDKPYAGTLEQLSKAEAAHARAIYRFWKHAADAPEPFENVYQSLTGEILEGGEPLMAVLERVQATSDRSCIDLFELALNIEIQAFDLYRTMADRESAREAREAFLSIAQMEKKHMQMLARAMHQC